MMADWLQREFESVRREGARLTSMYCHIGMQKHDKCTRGGSGCECPCHARTPVPEVFYQ